MQQPMPSPTIARLISALKQEMKLDPNAEEIADILWLTLEIEKCSPTVRSKIPSTPKIPELSKTVEPSALASDQPSLEQPQDSSQPSTSSPPAPLFSELPSDQSEEKSTALPIAIPAASALPRSLNLARSLRPLMRREKSRYRQILDEEATVTQIVDEEIWSPVMQPAPERWLELAIVVEETNLLDVWQETIVEVQHLMERHGAFRDVRAWQLVGTSGNAVQMFRRKGAVVDRSQARNPRELLDPTGRRLILFVSDCTSVGWASGRVPRLLAEWMSRSPVTVLQLLPERFWDRSALGLGDSVWLGSTLPGLLNDRLTVDGLPKRRSRVQSDKKEAQTQKLRMTLPIVTLEPIALLQWAKVIAGQGEEWTAGVVLELDQLHEEEGQKTELTQEKLQESQLLNPEQLVRRFRATASTTARRLAEMMAAVPVSWAVIRLIQKNLLPEAETIHIAEVFLSGLLHKESLGQEGSETLRLPQRYDFVAGVRKQLTRGVFVFDTEKVLENVADDLLSQLPNEVRQRLSEDIERRLGRSMKSFEAFLLPEFVDELLLDGVNQAEMLPFASVTSEVLEGLGGKYANLAEQLKRVPVEATEATEAPLSLPPLLDFEFEVAEFVETAEVSSARPLQQTPHEFEVATIEVSSVSSSGLHCSGVAQLLLTNAADDEKEHLVFITNDDLQWESYVEDERGMGAEICHTATYYSDDVTLEWSVYEYPQGTVNHVSEPEITRGEAEVVQDFMTEDFSIVDDPENFVPPVNIMRELKQNWQYIEQLGADVMLELVKIPAGSFVMGASEEELESHSSERPQHEVTVSEFYMGKYPVTQVQWRFVANLPEVERSLELNPSNFKGDDHPVEQVSWLDAVEFCARLSQHTGREYRLPSEAEWEYACRAGTTTPFHFGETIDAEIANYYAQDKKTNGNDHIGTYGRGRIGEYREQTTSVGSFEVANNFGLYDMHGDVWEWCLDPWHESYKETVNVAVSGSSKYLGWYKNHREAPIDGSAWIDSDAPKGNRRLLRGGSWVDLPQDCRSAYRNKDDAGNRNDVIGFRVVFSAITLL